MLITFIGNFGYLSFYFKENVPHLRVLSPIVLIHLFITQIIWRIFYKAETVLRGGKLIDKVSLLL